MMLFRSLYKQSVDTSTINHFVVNHFPTSNHWNFGFKRPTIYVPPKFVVWYRQVLHRPPFVGTREVLRNIRQTAATTLVSHSRQRHKGNHHILASVAQRKSWHLGWWLYASMKILAFAMVVTFDMTFCANIKCTTAVDSSTLKKWWKRSDWR